MAAVVPVVAGVRDAACLAAPQPGEHPFGVSRQEALQVFPVLAIDPADAAACSAAAVLVSELAGLDTVTAGVAVAGGVGGGRGDGCRESGDDK